MRDGSEMKGPAVVYNKNKRCVHTSEREAKHAVLKVLGKPFKDEPPCVKIAPAIMPRSGGPCDEAFPTQAEMAPSEWVVPRI